VSDAAFIALLSVLLLVNSLILVVIAVTSQH